MEEIAFDNKKKSKPSLLENTIAFLSPKWGLERKAYRDALELKAAYQGAIATRLSTRWGQTEALNALPHLNLTVARNMRARALSLVENNQLASSILDRAVENVVGNGFQQQATTSNPDFNQKADALFNNWKHEADFYGDSWVEHQKKTAYGLLRDGDHGAALLSKGQIQPVDADYISSPYDRPNAFLHDGIELDKYGKVKNYYVMTWVDFKQQQWQSVPKDKFLFVAHKRRVNTYRGDSYFAQSFDLFDSLERYIRATTIAQEIAACLAIFIKSTSPTALIQGLNTTRSATGGQSTRKMNLEPGMIQTLMPGEDIEQITPQQPGAGFSTNIQTLVRLCGLGFGLPLSYSFLDFSTVSGPTAKAEAQAAQRAFETIQRLLIDDYYRPIYRWKIDQWIDDGELEDIPDKYSHIWHPEPWPYLDIIKEIQGIMLEIDAGLNTERGAIIARGKDPDKIRLERAAELQWKRDNNVPIYHSSTVQPLIKTSVTDAETGSGVDDTGANADANGVSTEKEPATDISNGENNAN